MIGTLFKQLVSVRSYFLTGATDSFLIRFAGEADPRQQSDGQAAWKAMIKKYPNSSTHQRSVLVRQLNSIVIMQNQDPDENPIEMFQPRDDLDYTGKSFEEARILNLILWRVSPTSTRPSDSPPRGTPRFC